MHLHFYTGNYHLKSNFYWYRPLSNKWEKRIEEWCIRLHYYYCLMTRIQIINYSLWPSTQVSDMYSSQSEDLSRLLCKKNDVVVNDKEITAWLCDSKGCLEKDSGRPPVSTRKSPGNHCLAVFKKAKRHATFSSII